MVLDLEQGKVFKNGGANNSFRPARLIICSSRLDEPLAVLVYIIAVEHRMSSPKPHALKNELRYVCLKIMRISFVQQRH